MKNRSSSPSSNYYMNEEDFVLTGLPTNISIPMVCIVVEGGPNTIKQAHEAVENGSPVVVVGKSGRAADVMAASFRG